MGVSITLNKTFSRTDNIKKDIIIVIRRLLFVAFSARDSSIVYNIKIAIRHMGPY